VAKAISHAPDSISTAAASSRSSRWRRNQRISTTPVATCRWFRITRSRLDEVVPIGNGAMADRTFVEWDKDDLDALAS